jgi:lysine/ornithine N-monooxygenase
MIPTNLDPQQSGSLTIETQSSDYKKSLTKTTLKTDVSKEWSRQSGVDKYDVCIIGAGPAALACLSAIREPYTLDHLTEEQITRANHHLLAQRKQVSRRKKNRGIHDCGGKTSHRENKLKVAVIDPNSEWMMGWKNQFDALNIKVLRSPALAHPDIFDSNALLAYAQINNRQDELIESGCFDLKELLPLGQSQIGLWKLPTCSLFVDFCIDLVSRLEHTFLSGTVNDINLLVEKDNNQTQVTRKQTREKIYEVSMLDGSKIHASNVILAMGTVGRPNIPAGLVNVPSSRIVPWKKLDTELKAGTTKRWKKVLVVGGGLTAVQAAQRLTMHNCRDVTICSRRPLTERHFDLHVDWFDQRTKNKCMSDFYHQAPAFRLRLLKECRNGGSVPALYMKDINRLEHESNHNQATRLFRRVTGQAEFLGLASNDALCLQINPSNHDDREKFVEHYDTIVLACGMQPDCASNDLCSKILHKWPIEIVGGFPCITEDAKWRDDANIYVIGGLGSMNIGPDSANLMGIRRAAEIIANALECRTWLRSESNVLQNPFVALTQDESDNEYDSDVSSNYDPENDNSSCIVLD